MKEARTTRKKQLAEENQLFEEEVCCTHLESLINRLTAKSDNCSTFDVTKNKRPKILNNAAILMIIAKTNSFQT
ncbi:hypothetical protein EVAR_33080_1 [Eumeta japonica]|uniref:Uncharacterized protein n=1 Tax=Eumeta variegata TaxID=151549 RepID=A0A4C2A5Q8_EUMVA|nr:hypothetical protein EVAR_33080_1 [Eumeta japonica]